MWSGDWRQDSAAAAEELARRRAEAEEPTETPEPEPPDDGPSVTARAAERLRRHRTSLLVVLGSLLVAAVAFGAVSLVAGSGGKSSRNGAGLPAYLGVNMASTPFSFQGSGTGFPFANGVMVVSVVPGGPAAAAGLEPGDVITASTTAR